MVGTKKELKAVIRDSFHFKKMCIMRPPLDFLQKTHLDSKRREPAFGHMPSRYFWQQWMFEKWRQRESYLSPGNEELRLFLSPSFPLHAERARTVRGRRQAQFLPSNPVGPIDFILVRGKGRKVL